MMNTDFLFIQNPNPMFIYDVESLGILDVNNAALTLYGYERGELTKLKVTDLQPAEAQGEFLDYLARNKERKATTTTCQHQKKNGEYLYLDIHASRVECDKKARLVSLHDRTPSIKTQRKIRNYRSNSPLAFFELAADNTICEWSEKAQQKLGWSEDQVLGKRPADIGMIHAGDQPQMLQILKNLHDGDTQHEQITIRNLTLNENTRHCQWFLSSYRNDQGDFVGIQVQLLDVTGNEKNRRNLEKEQKFSNKVINSLPGTFYMADEAGNLLRWNDNVKRIIGYSDDELRRMNVVDFVPQVEQLGLVNRFQSVFEKGYTELEVHLKTKDGSLIPFLFNGSGILFEGKPVVVGTGTDISRIHYAEREASRTRELMQSIMDQTNSLIFIKDEKGRYLMVNNEFEELFDLPKSSILGKTDDELIPKEIARRFAKNDRKVLDTGTTMKFEDRLAMHGQNYWFLTVKFPLRNVKGFEHGMCGIATDITQQKRNQQKLKELYQKEKDLRNQAEKANHRLHFLYEATQKLTSSLDYKETLNQLADIMIPEFADWCVIDLVEGPKTMNRIVNKTRTPEKLRYSKKLKSNESSRNIPQQYLDRIIRDEEPILVSEITDSDLYEHAVDEQYYRILKKIKLKSAILLPIQSQNSVIGIMTLMSCESGKVYDENDLQFAVELAERASLAVENARIYTRIHENLNEKETLLQEIHHRVKNNLAIISGLLQLQAMNTEDEELSHQLLDSESRIHAIAHIHELLYQSESFSRIRFDRQLKKLIHSIVQSFKTNDNVTVETDLDAIDLNVNQAIPLALLLNELITNVIEHAFPEKHEGHLSVSLHNMSNNEVRLRVKDNGIGIPEEYKPEDSDSLGMNLIHMLSHQLEAEMNYTSAPGEGTDTSIQFKKSEVRGSSSSWTETQTSYN